MVKADTKILQNLRAKLQHMQFIPLIKYCCSSYLWSTSLESYILIWWSDFRWLLLLTAQAYDWIETSEALWRHYYPCHMYRYPSLYEHSIYIFSLQWRMLICTCFSLNKFNFWYNEQFMSMFVRSFFGKVQKYAHNRWGEADIPAHVHFPPSQSVHTPHCGIMWNQLHSWCLMPSR